MGGCVTKSCCVCCFGHIYPYRFYNEPYAATNGKRPSRFPCAATSTSECCSSSRDLSTPICPVARYPSFFMFELCRFAQVCTICFPAMLTKKLCSETPRSCTTRWRGWVPMRCVQAADASARHTQNDILGLSALRIDTSLHACSRLRCARPI